MANAELKFPEVIYVSHYDHSTNESPSLNACLKPEDAIKDGEITPVAEYKLVKVRRLMQRVEEVPLE
jgi:hypothetical protein